MPLRELVKDFVACSTEEITIHKLSQHSASFQGVTDRGANNGCFTDGSIKQSMIWQGFRQPAIHREGATPIPVLLPISHHGWVDVKAVQDGFENRVAYPDTLAFG